MVTLIPLDDEEMPLPERNPQRMRDDPPGTAIGRIASRAAQAAVEGFQPEVPAGPGPDATNWLQRQGWYSSPGDEGWRGMVAQVNEAILRPALEGGDIILRGGQAIYRATGATVAGMAKETFGMSDGDADRLERDALALLDVTGVAAGFAPPMMRVPRAPAGRSNLSPPAVEGAPVAGMEVGATRPPRAASSPVPETPAPAAAPRTPIATAADDLAPKPGTVLEAETVPPVVPKPVDPLPPTPEIAGNINLNRINAPEEVKRAIIFMADENRDFYTARRGVMTKDTTDQLAREMGMTAADVNARISGQAYNAEQMLAARDLMVRQAETVTALAKAGDNPTKFYEEFLRLSAIQEQVAGATAEAGRALASFRIMAGNQRGVKAMLDLAQDSNASELMAKIAALDGDPAKLAHMVKSMRHGIWANVRDGFYELWMNSLLSGPATHATNMLSNSLVSLWSVPEKLTAATISKLSGSGISYREAFAHAIGTADGIKDGVRAMLRTWVTEEMLFESGKLDVRRLQVIPGAAGRFFRIPGRALEAEDALFKSIAYRQQLSALAVRQAMQEGASGVALARRITELKANPTPDMINASRKFALQQTFSDTPGAIGQSFLKVRDAVPGMKFVMPFVRTPSNIVLYTAERTPFGALFKDTQAKIRAGGAARDEELAKMAFGSAVATTLGLYVADGTITGGGPMDPEERAVLQARGWQPYSIKVGDTYYSYGRLEPLGLLLGATADAVELGEKIGVDEADDIAVLTIGSVARNLTSKTYLRGLSDAVEAINDPVRAGKIFVQNLAGTVVPTGVAQFARADDPFLREARSILDKIKERIPGVREELPLRRDVFGETIENEGGTFIERFTSPIYRKTAKPEVGPMVDELLRLEAAPGRLTRKIQGVELSGDEYSAYRRTLAGRPRPI